MVPPQYLGGMTVFVILALYKHGNSNKIFKIELKNAEDIQSVQSPGYPDYLLPFSAITWKIYAPDGFLMELDCSEITLTQNKLNKLFLRDGSKHTDIGEYSFKRSLSTGRYMELELKTGLSFDRINCSVRPIPKEAPDSGELGFGPQHRSTSCPCGWTNKPSKKRIVGGRGALPNEFVFIAYLRIPLEKLDVKKYYQCSASILTKRHILTAAHCFKYKSNLYEVVVGGHDLFNGSTNGENQTIKINKTHVHESYNIDTHVHDIAVIELTEDIMFSQFVGPVCLPSESYNLRNQWVKALGWGRFSRAGNYSQTLKTVNLREIDGEECLKEFPSLRGIETKFCLSSHYGVTCTGDSGGPLVHYDEEIDRYVQVGVLVSGCWSCKVGTPCVGMNVFLYLDWIKGIIENKSSGLPICQKV